MSAYQRLSIEKFGAHLIESRDLDPVYCALVGAAPGWSAGQLHRWLVAYWCFYHCGVASYLSEHKDWDLWMAAAKNVNPPIGDRWPRGRERRHFRGANAVNAVQHLRDRYSWPELMVDAVADEAPNFGGVASAVQTHVGFGPWIAFKVADMLDRVCQLPVDFAQAHVFMFKDPRQAAVRLWAEVTNQPPGAKPKDEPKVIEMVVNHLQKQFGHMLAPPLFDRGCGLQEIETVLCKWKSHMDGHYPLLNDITEITEGTEPWRRVSPTAGSFLRSMPPAEKETQ